MGIQWYTESTTMMKSIVFAALLAAVYAEAEADAGLYYGGYGYGGYGYGSYGLRSYAAPAYGYRSYSTYAAPAYGIRSYGYGLHGLHKRSADAEADAEADAGLYYGGYGYAAPAYGYSRSYGYGYAAPAYGVRSYAAYAAPAYGYRSHGYGLHGLHKRSADAEADASYLYGGYGYAASPVAYSGYAAAAPIAHVGYSAAPLVSSAYSYGGLRSAYGYGLRSAYGYGW